MVEYLPFKQRVLGSSPSRPKEKIGCMPGFFFVLISKQKRDTIGAYENTSQQNILQENSERV